MLNIKGSKKPVLCPDTEFPSQADTQPAPHLEPGPAPHLDAGPAPAERCAGMTLLELLIAIAIFSLVAATAYAALSQGLLIQDRLQEQRRFWQRFEAVFNMVHTDLEQAVDLAPRAAGSSIFTGYEQGNSAEYAQMVEFTRNVDTAFHTGPASPFLRVAYSLRDGGLYRRTWPGVSRPYGIAAAENLILEDVGNIRLRYLVDAGRWLKRWPQQLDNEDSPGLPRAIEMVVELQEKGAYRWLFHVGPPR